MSTVVRSWVFFNPRSQLNSIVVIYPRNQVLPMPCMLSTKLYSPALIRVHTLYLCLVHGYLLPCVEADNMASTQKCNLIRTRRGSYPGLPGKKLPLCHLSHLISLSILVYSYVIQHPVTSHVTSHVKFLIKIKTLKRNKFFIFAFVYFCKNSSCLGSTYLGPHIQTTFNLSSVLPPSFSPLRQERSEGALRKK